MTPWEWEKRPISYLYLTILHNFDCLTSKLLHPHPPLGLHNRLNNVLGLFTQRDLHWVVLLVDIKTLFLEIILDGVSDIESLLTLVPELRLFH